MVALAFMFVEFSVWGVAGNRGERETRQLKGGIIAGCWSAMISMLMAVTLGLVLMMANMPPPSDVATWRELAQSGWTNAYALAIANSLDAACVHLIIGPVVGIICGLFGGGIAKLACRRSVAVPEC
jgi:hypothetical protein